MKGFFKFGFAVSVGIIIGIFLGILAMVHIVGETVSVEVKKVKNKRISGDIDTTIPVTVRRARDVREKRKRRKNDKQPKQ